MANKSKFNFWDGETSYSYRFGPKSRAKTIDDKTAEIYWNFGGKFNHRGGIGEIDDLPKLDDFDLQSWKNMLGDLKHYALGRRKSAHGAWLLAKKGNLDEDPTMDESEVLKLLKEVEYFISAINAENDRRYPPQTLEDIDWSATLEKLKKLSKE